MQANVVKMPGRVDYFLQLQRVFGCLMSSHTFYQIPYQPAVEPGVAYNVFFEGCMVTFRTRIIGTNFEKFRAAFSAFNFFYLLMFLYKSCQVYQDESLLRNPR